ncbi:hypothetical protein GFL96_34775 [Rhizobium leguminosarum bv. viciae]|nr:hypothetical protein [Rhizobium leguminosarum bv. viciae]
MTAGHSHFDIMTKYRKLQGWGEYQTEHREDHEPYPDEWVLLSYASGEGRRLGCLSVKSVWLPIPRE